MSEEQKLDVIRLLRRWETVPDLADKLLDMMDARSVAAGKASGKNGSHPDDAWNETDSS